MLAFNSEFRGFATYYAIADGVKSSLGRLELVVFRSVMATLASRHRKSAGWAKKHLKLGVDYGVACNRLDTKAIGACSDFMRSLGLQVVVATPDEKRHIFMEVADTIVNVNRSGNVVLVDCEYLTEKTRQALPGIDPYRKGFDAFKAEMIAASLTPEAAAAQRQEAAE